MKDWCLEVWGEYACFTRPEMKVERVSYSVMTPSAARGVLEAVIDVKEYPRHRLDVDLAEQQILEVTRMRGKDRKDVLVFL